MHPVVELERGHVVRPVQLERRAVDGRGGRLEGAAVEHPDQLDGVVAVRGDDRVRHAARRKGVDPRGAAERVKAVRGAVGGGGGRLQGAVAVYPDKLDGVVAVRRHGGVHGAAHGEVGRCARAAERVKAVRGAVLGRVGCIHGQRVCSPRRGRAGYDYGPRSAERQLAVQPGQAQVRRVADHVGDRRPAGRKGRYVRVLQAGRRVGLPHGIVEHERVRARAAGVHGGRAGVQPEHGRAAGHRNGLAELYPDSNGRSAAVHAVAGERHDPQDKRRNAVYHDAPGCAERSVRSGEGEEQVGADSCPSGRARYRAAAASRQGVDAVVLEQAPARVRAPGLGRRRRGADAVAGPYRVAELELVGAVAVRVQRRMARIQEQVRAPLDADRARKAHRNVDGLAYAVRPAPGRR